MENQLSVLQRNHLETVGRAANAVVPQVILAFFLWAVYGLAGGNAIQWTIGFSGMVILQFIRLILHLKNQTDDRILLRNIPVHFTLILVGACWWGMISAAGLYEFGLDSVAGITTLFTLTGILSAIAYSLAASPLLQRGYVFLLVAPTVFVLQFNEDVKKGPFISLIMIIYAFYLLALARRQRDEVRAKLEYEERIFKEHETLKMIVNTVPGFVAVVDLNGRLIEAGNQSQFYMEVPAIQTLMGRFIESGLHSLTREVEWAEAGRERALVLSLTRLGSESVVLVGLPVDELKAIKKQLEIQKSKAEQAAQMATLGEIAAGIAHEINNPLAVITGSAFQIRKILNERYPEEKNLIAHTEKVSRTAERIAKIIQGLKYMSRQVVGDPFEMTDLRVLVRDTLELCQEKFYKNGVDLKVADVPEVQVPVRAVQISQVLLNLLGNAMDAVLKQPLRLVEISFEIKANQLLIRIQDSGPGVPPEIAEKIFQPFFTTKQTGQGTGLGLSVSKGIMAEHQGSLSLRMGPGPTTFEICLPLQRSES